jgi:hypothetical protein
VTGGVTPPPGCSALRAPAAGNGARSKPRQCRHSRHSLPVNESELLLQSAFEQGEEIPLTARGVVPFVPTMRMPRRPDWCRPPSTPNALQRLSHLLLRQGWERGVWHRDDAFASLLKLHGSGLEFELQPTVGDEAEAPHPWNALGPRDDDAPAGS